MPFNYFIPTEIKYGEGAAKGLGKIAKRLGAQKIFIVTDKGIIAADILNEIEESIKEANLDYKIFDGVEPNPSVRSIDSGVEQLKEYDGDLVVALGGGSCIDCAKAIAVMVKNSGDILDYAGSNKIKCQPLPIVAIPTTAGTGSEVTNTTVITDTKKSFKVGIVSPYLYPTVAILDPNLTLKLPQGMTAATGMDALTHALETYISKEANPISQALAIQAIKMIAQNIDNAYFVGSNREGRGNMLLASAMAGIAFSHSRLGNVHAISHTFGGMFNIPHGIANATLLPYVMKFNLPSCLELYKDIAIALGNDVASMSTYEAASTVITTIIAMNERLNIPNNIKDIGVNLDQLDKLVDDSMKSGNIAVNPRITNKSDIELIIRAAYSGDLNKI